MDSERIEQGILNYLARQPAGERGGVGTMYVKVVLDEPSPDSGEQDGEVFLSMPYLRSDRGMLAAAHAQIREGFERGEILDEQAARVEIGEQPGTSYGHEDAEVGGKLLTLPIPIKVQPPE
jgi:hypothetical protein